MSLVRVSCKSLIDSQHPKQMNKLISIHEQTYYFLYNPTIYFKLFSKIKHCILITINKIQPQVSDDKNVTVISSNVKCYLFT